MSDEEFYDEDIEYSDDEEMIDGTQDEDEGMVNRSSFEAV